MNIAIPTYKRSDKQLTLQLLEKENYPKHKIILFVEPEEKDKYSQYGVNVVVLKPTNGNMSMVSNQILDFMKPRQYLWVCDDITDLKKVAGKKGKYWYYENCTLQEIVDNVSPMLLKCAVVQIPTERRGVLKKDKKRFKQVKNLHTFYFVNSDRLNGITYDESLFPDDYDFGFQIILKGVGGVVDFKYVHNALHWENEGGCKIYRNEKIAKEMVLRYKKKYGNKVKVILNKTSGLVEARWNG